MELFIDNRQDEFEINDQIIEDIETTILETLKVEGIDQDYEISLSFVSDQEIRELNRDYRGKDEITDVLSFPLQDEFHMGPPMLGDIIISLDRAYIQAQDYKHSFKREVAYLICHSMLHLIGYDHLEDDEKSIMREKEKKIMRNLKIFKGD